MEKAECSKIGTKTPKSVILLINVSRLIGVYLYVKYTVVRKTDGTDFNFHR